ncbi:hypothetical protein [Mycobacterium sp.]|uniref:hypothetical protein n=1 Tax=Mycobacterium sp. TaxID=1785 RepID=UPI003BB0E34C
MQYSWHPAGKGHALHGRDGSEWNVGTLPNGCTVLWGRDALGRWSATCTVHGMLPIDGPDNAHTSWQTAMAHKP